ncbi:MAG: anhydro-N-acetylmuramic acid kinase [Candidatus Hydrogenedentes bacterium]|nr:anhydro-N-acetylmuramic acid kinase [Candidatus Hydrogenedentota bacterium]
MDLRVIQKKQARFCVGLMSGTSCDGVDAALVRIQGTGKALAMNLIAHETFPYTAVLRNKLLDEHLSIHDACSLDFELGARFAEAAQAMIDRAHDEDITVDFVASHGHTLAHIPPSSSEKIGTLQIGQSAIIAEHCSVPVVSDFRPRDMAVGGQGAPLVPYADWLLFHRLKRPIACLNIGGIANFTVVTPEFRNIRAFDTGPGNMAIDGAMRLLTSGMHEMDKDGKAAAAGMIIDEFLDYLLDHPFFNKVPPKSTGREEFGMQVYLRDALTARSEHSLEDLVATVTEAVARSIIEAYDRFIKPENPAEHIIIGGGGAHNKALLERLTGSFGDAQVFTSDQYGIPPDAREAIAFAILGNEFIMGTAANVPCATGAERRVVLGKITPA